MATAELIDEMTEDYEYDVALSYAGEDREYVKKVANSLRRRGIRIFYDEYQRTALWGKDLYEHLDWVYQRAARFCVLFISTRYAKRVWTDHELKSAQARAIEQKSEYILPTRFDDTQLPGVRHTVAGLDLRGITPSELARTIIEKLGPLSRRNFFPPDPDLLVEALNPSREHEAEISLRAHAFFRTLQRMTQQERSLVFAILCHTCPAGPPENAHINLDLLRRITGIPPSEALNILKGLRSLHFRSQVREEPDHESDDSDDVLYLTWFDYGAYDDSDFNEDAALYNDGNATEIACAMVAITSHLYCDDHVMMDLQSMDFSALSSRTARGHGT
jgi:TIR domain-containing protein